MIRPAFIGALDRVSGIPGLLPDGEAAASPASPGPRGFAPPPAAPPPDPADLELILAAGGEEELSVLFRRARRVRELWCGERMVLRGLVEFSSYCGNSCFYCGLNRDNRALSRYRLSAAELLAAAGRVAEAGVRTVVLQSGEDGMDARSLAALIEGIKARWDIAVTLSVGERPAADYRLWKAAGADRYLLRIESSDAALYASVHRGRTLDSRLRCLDELRAAGYQVGSGIMVGLPGQDIHHLARDLRFFWEQNFDMVGIGPFIPHPDTPFRDEARGDLLTTLKAIALTRIVTRNAWMPATTALGSLDRDYRIDGLLAGANVVMPNFSPPPYKKLYEIYPGKRCVDEPSGACMGCMGALASAASLSLDCSRADSLKLPAPRTFG